MSEKHVPAYESHKKHEHVVSPEHRHELEKNIHEQAERAKNELGPDSIERLREKAEQHAHSAEQIQVEQSEKEPDTGFDVQHLLKSKAYSQTLKGVQRKLPALPRAFSKVAHNKTVEAISNAGAQTVARPSGILGGSLCAFIGTTLLLYASRHYGFTYNYGVFLLLFVGGFLVGLVAELLIWTLYSRKHRQY